MLRFVIGLMITGFAMTVHAEDKTCTVEGMHCTACKEMIEGKVCDETKYSTCDVKISNAKKKLGQIRLATKDATSKIDEDAIGAIVKDSGYEMKKCVQSKAKSAGAAAKAKG